MVSAMGSRRAVLITLLSLLFVQGEAFCACLQNESSQLPQEEAEHHHHQNVSHEQNSGGAGDCGTNECEHCSEALHAARPEFDALVANRASMPSLDNDSGEPALAVDPFPSFERCRPPDYQYLTRAFVACDSPVTRADALLE